MDAAASLDGPQMAAGRTRWAVAGGSWVEAVLDDKEVDAAEDLLEECVVGEGHGRVGGYEPKGFDLASDGGFDDVGVG